MNVVVGSMFRDSVNDLPAYFTLVEFLRKMLQERGDALRVVAVENDSTDETWDVLDHWLFGTFADGVLIKASDGCPYYPSTDHQPRWQHIAWVCNQILDEMTPDDDVLAYIESDLVWDPAEILSLIDRAYGTTTAWTGAIYHEECGTRWYDTWGTTLDGEPFRGAAPPYHSKWTGEPMRVDTCASVLVCPVALARETRFSPIDAFRGWTREINERGGEVWLDPKVGVVHP